MSALLTYLSLSTGISQIELDMNNIIALCQQTNRNVIVEADQSLAPDHQKHLFNAYLYKNHSPLFDRSFTGKIGFHGLKKLPYHLFFDSSFFIGKQSLKVLVDPNTYGAFYGKMSNIHSNFFWGFGFKLGFFLKENLGIYGLCGLSDVLLDTTTTDSLTIEKQKTSRTSYVINSIEGGQNSSKTHHLITPYYGFGMMTTLSNKSSLFVEASSKISVSIPVEDEQMNDIPIEKRTMTLSYWQIMTGINIYSKREDA